MRKRLVYLATMIVASVVLMFLVSPTLTYARDGDTPHVDHDKPAADHSHDHSGGGNVGGNSDHGSAGSGEHSGGGRGFSLGVNERNGFPRGASDINGNDVSNGSRGFSLGVSEQNSGQRGAVDLNGRDVNHRGGWSGGADHSGNQQASMAGFWGGAKSCLNVIGSEAGAAKSALSGGLLGWFGAALGIMSAAENAPACKQAVSNGYQYLKDAHQQGGDWCNNGKGGGYRRDGLDYNCPEKKTTTHQRLNNVYRGTAPPRDDLPPGTLAN